MLSESDLRLIEAHHGIRRLDALTQKDFTRALPVARQVMQPDQRR